MHNRLLTFLRCPQCAGELEIAHRAAGGADEDVHDGLLACPRGHWFPIVRGIPRMLPDSLEEHRQQAETACDVIPDDRAESLRTALRAGSASAQYDRRTRENFSLEWDFHEVGDNTWGIDLEERVRTFFVEPIGIPEPDLKGLVMLDAGCGNGSQSVVYTEYGVEVIALDLSSGIEHGKAFLSKRPNARPELIHFVQGDLQHPPLADGCIDLVHSAGVLHHTPDTEGTFHRLCRTLTADGTFYVWLYKHEQGVTPVVNSIRTLTTRMSPSSFARLARALAGTFQVFRAALDKVGARSYPPITRRESALALMDIFGAPHAHAHTYTEVEGWYRQEGFVDVWPCNDDRRGFGACGRRGPGAPPHPVPAPE